MERDAARLSELLASLKVDSLNPDLWMEAATIYVAMGKEDRASQAYQASLKVVEPRKGEAQVLEQIRDLLWGDTVPTEGEEQSSEGAQVPDPTASEVSPQESPLLAPRVMLATVEEKASNFANAEEALDQLRRELDPHGTVTCPDCNTLLESGDRWCYGCGREVIESGESLEERAVRARGRLTEDEDDPDALFTLAAYLAVSGQHDEALEHLIRLTALDPRYPGLWWVKARVFMDAGKIEAANASLRMAIEIMTEAGLGPRA